MVVYKICGASEWGEAIRCGVFRGSAADVRDGYIHLSTAAQVAETARKHFAGQSDLVLVAIDADRLGAALVWERSRGGALFPHSYGPLGVDSALWTKPLPLDPDGVPRLPESLPC